MKLNRCHFGDVLRILPEMIEGKVRVNAIVTSIPYWAQRDYRIPPVIWGGDPKHAHRWTATGKVGGGGRKHTAGSVQNGKKQMEQHEALQHASTGDTCSCGAWRGQFGLERTFDCLGWATGAACEQCYICHVLTIFRLLHKLLADDGTLWLNVGDSYSSGGRGGHRPSENFHGHDDEAGDMVGVRKHAPAGIKPKDILAQPWHIGLALRYDGWYLRRPIIWWKKNCMPSSAKDRTTDDYEYLLMCAKRRHYFYDWVAIAEPTSPDTHARAARGNTSERKFADGGAARTQTLHCTAPSAGTLIPGVNPKAQGFPTGWDGVSKSHKEMAGNYPAPRVKQNMDFSAAVSGHNRAIRNKRSVWPIAAEPFHGKHYATFPRALVEPCILAGTSARGHCPKCGRGWRRVIAKGNTIEEWKRMCGADASGGYNGKSRKDYAGARAQDASATKARILAGMREILTVGWEPTCKCGLAPVPAVVLDPFAGSNTTGSQCERLGRNWLAIEINRKDKVNQRIRFAQKESVKRVRRKDTGQPLQLEIAI